MSIIADLEALVPFDPDDRAGRRTYVRGVLARRKARGLIAPWQTRPLANPKTYVRCACGVQTLDVVAQRRGHEIRTHAGEAQRWDP